MKKLLIIAFRYISKQKRVLRQLYYLRKKYEVYAVGFDDNLDIEGIRYFQITPRFLKMNVWQKAITVLLLGCHQFERAYPQMYEYEGIAKELANIQFDLLLVHDIKPLPLVCRSNTAGKMLIDVHEYFFDELDNTASLLKEPINYFLNALLQNFNMHLIKTYFLHCEHFFTVSQGIADEYYKQTGKIFDVITSAHDYVPLEPTPVKSNKIRMVHHGRAGTSRKLELMIEMMDDVDERFELDLMLTSVNFNDTYFGKLRRMSEIRRNVRIIPPVTPNEIIPFTNQYDIGLYILPPTNFNWAHALPNKFFEFIQARLCIAIGPTPDMAKIVKEYNLGIVADDFQPKTMATNLNRLTKEQIEFYKQQCHNHARELSSETEMKKLKNIIENLSV